MYEGGGLFGKRQLIRKKTEILSVLQNSFKPKKEDRSKFKVFGDDSSAESSDSDQDQDFVTLISMGNKNPQKLMKIDEIIKKKQSE